MTQALDLLNALSPQEIAAMTAQPDPEGHIIVGGDRFITVPSNLKRLGVQYDHNMETVTFDCPRYWDDRDMSKMAVYVNYMRSDGYSDRYPVDNLRADGEVMHFDWTISRNVTEIPGTVAFLVCVAKTDSEGNEERHWNSELCNECYVSQGMETEEHPVLQYPDEVTQLLLRMATVEQINVQAEEIEQILAEVQETAAIAEETKNQALDASNHIKNSYAPAIKGNVSGEIIRVDDVSPIEHDVKCWVHGKNLLNDVEFKVETKTIGGVTCTANADGSYTISGANTSSSFATFGSNRATNLENEPIIPKGTYTPTPGITVVCRDTVTRKETNYQQTFEAPNPFRIVGWYCYVGPNTAMLGGAYTNLPATIYPQLEQGSTATTYEPYIDPTTVTAIGCGKNLIDVDMMCNAALTKSNDQYTFKKGETSDERFSDVMPIYIPANTPVYISAIFGNYTVSDTSLYMIIKYDDGTEAFPGIRFSESGRLLNLTKNTTGIQFYIQGTESAGAYLTFKNLQLEIGEAPTAYEMYKKSIATPAIDGTCTVTSKSPTMTLFTDTPGVTIEAEYNRDTTKMFESYVLTDEAKQEIAILVSKPTAAISGNVLIVK